MTVSERCRGTSQSGDLCSAKPLAGQAWCHWHHPDREDIRRESRQRGGENSSREVRAKKLLRKGLQDLGDVRDVLLMALSDVQGGRLDPKVANAMANLAGKIKDLTIGVDLEEQITDMQRRMGDLAEQVSAS